MMNRLTSRTRHGFLKATHPALLCLAVILPLPAAAELSADAPVTLTTFSQSDSRLGLNAQPNKAPLRIAAKAVAKGISTSTAVLEFELEREFNSFSVDLGMTEGAAGDGTFYILLDEAILHRGVQSPTQDCDDHRPSLRRR